jgi:lysophospholipase L1-like esterase
MKRIFFLPIMLCLHVTVLAQITNQRLFDTIPFIPDHSVKRMALFASEPFATGQVIFLGNSITEGGPWASLIKDKPILNRGIGGDITFGVLKRLDDIIKRQPSKLFILIGINDIGKDIPDAVIADNCRKIVERVQKGSPKTEVFLQSILPVNPTVKNFPQHYDKQEHVTATNRLLKDIAAKANITYVDLHSIFLNGNKLLNEQFTNDGLHLTQAGYEAWVKFLVEKKYL